MKMLSPTTAVTCLMLGTSTAFATIAEGGLAVYSIELSQEEASIGDTVNVDVWLEMDSEGGPFSGLAVAAFDVMALDPEGPSGLISNRSLAPAWSTLGSIGSVSTDDITGIEAGQFPILESGTNVLLYSYDYTVGSATERIIEFDVSWAVPVTVFGESFIDVQPYATSSDGPARLSVVPAPGAFALLGLAGFAARGRRRRTTSG